MVNKCYHVHRMTKYDKCKTSYHQAKFPVLLERQAEHQQNQQNPFITSKSSLTLMKSFLSRDHEHSTTPPTDHNLIAHATDQFDDLDEHPVIGGAGHQFKEEWSERQVVLGVLARQLTDDIHCSRLHT